MNTSARILDAAENNMRLKGYHAVSFRDLAEELDIKSSSVHYHFNQKEDLGVALVERYHAAFFAEVERCVTDLAKPVDRLRAFAAVYRNALTNCDNICLCGMLGAEILGLPEPVSVKVKEFFAENIAWISGNLPQFLPKPERHSRAVQILATLQGAMMLSKALNDVQLFDASIAGMFPPIANRKNVSDALKSESAK